MVHVVSFTPQLHTNQIFSWLKKKDYFGLTLKQKADITATEAGYGHAHLTRSCYRCVWGALYTWFPRPTLLAAYVPHIDDFILTK